MTSQETSPKAVQVADLSVDLGGRLVLRGVDLQIRQGEVVAILGTNGSGKSTLIRTVVGLLPAARGEVRLFGTAVPRFRQWRRVGYVPQRITAAGGVPATVHEVVSSGLLSKRRLFTPLRAADTSAFSSILPPVFGREAVEYYCRHEWVVHLDDLLLRRTSWHFYEKNADGLAWQAAHWMAESLEWDAKRIESELRRYSQQSCLAQVQSSKRGRL